MKGAQMHSVRERSSDEVPNSFSHLLGGFIGETHGEDLVRRHALVNQVADSMSDDACFSAPGTC